MKFGAVPKLDKRNTTMLKKFGGDVASANYDIIVIIAKDG